MNHQIKSLIQKTHNEFVMLSNEDKVIVIQTLKTKLQNHHNAINSIGMGNPEYYVIAANIYLRYIRRYKLISPVTDFL
jgi:hypothetical protein